MFHLKKQPAAQTNNIIQKAENKQWEVVKELVRGGADVNLRDKDGFSVYDWARYYDNRSMIRWLLHHGFKPNLSPLGQVPYLQQELIKDNWAIAKLLIRHGADLQIKVYDLNILQYAAQREKWDVVFTILKQDFPIDPNDPFIIKLFHGAAEEGQLSIVQFLLRRHVSLLNVYDGEGKNALHHAIEGHRRYLMSFRAQPRVPVIRYLLNHEININTPYKSALKQAAVDKLGFVANLLIAHAHIDIKNDQYQSLLTENERTWLAEIQTDTMNTSLHDLMWARYQTRSDYNPDSPYVIRNHMEANSCHIDSKKDGYTPLYLAVKSNNKPACVKVLLGYGADVNVKNHGDTAIRCAIKINNPEVLGHLARFAAHIHPKDANLLMHALVQYKEWKLIRHLIRHQARLEGTNDKGQSILQIAIHKNQWKTVYCLLRHNAQTNKLTEEEFAKLKRHLVKHHQRLSDFTSTFFKKEAPKSLPEAAPLSPHLN